MRAMLYAAAHGGGKSSVILHPMATSSPHKERVALSLVVPAYNEGQRLPRTLTRIREYLDASGEHYEVIVVDDGSDDGTAIATAAIAKQWPELDVVSLPANRGKGAAVREGMLRATGAHRAFSDADLSTPIEELPRLRERLNSTCQVAIASRDAPGSHIEIHQPAWREFMGRTYNRLLRFIILPGFADTQCGFKVFTEEAAVRCFVPLQTMRFGFDAEVLLRARRAGWSIDEVPVRWRHVEKSRVGSMRDSSRMLYDLLRLRFRKL
jgi:dolichyl-phosphate beta-glucosyltransferase